MIALKKILIDMIEREQADTPESDWHGSAFEGMRYVQIDARGRMGEELCRDILSERFHVVGAEGKMDSYGEIGYNFVVEDVRVVVKCATRGKSNNTFQHEHLKPSRQFDIIILVDVAPEKIYVKMALKQQLPWEAENQHGRKMTERENGDYKWNTSIKQHEAEGNEVETEQDIITKFEEVMAEWNNMKLNSF